MSNSIKEIVNNLLKNVQDCELDLSGRSNWEYIYENIRFIFKLIDNDSDMLFIKASIENQSWSRIGLSNTDGLLVKLANDFGANCEIDGDSSRECISEVHVRRQIQASEVEEKLIDTLNDMCTNVSEASNFLDRKLCKKSVKAREH